MSKVVWSETPYWISGSLAVRRGFHNSKVRGLSLATTFFFFNIIKFLTKQNNLNAKHNTRSFFFLNFFFFKN